MFWETASIVLLAAVLLSACQLFKRACFVVFARTLLCFRIAVLQEVSLFHFKWDECLPGVKRISSAYVRENL